MFFGESDPWRSGSSLQRSPGLHGESINRWVIVSSSQLGIILPCRLESSLSALLFFTTSLFFAGSSLFSQGGVI